ncbi:hypothetical protein [Tychonema sp. BBK16]|uniref:hypothetical protein n=1 Tax=Tychonema sp. BBK16 TaxID=2699888 RepID=UPI001F1CF4E7|nr:hypothetical protein [Tychonema sp. BBK16]MCF6374664.1 hypothetical protein [Tychonema sp. BBK16]
MPVNALIKNNFVASKRWCDRSFLPQINMMEKWRSLFFTADKHGGKKGDRTWKKKSDEYWILIYADSLKILTRKTSISAQMVNCFELILLIFVLLEMWL